MSPPPVVKVIDASNIVATWDRVLINVWRGEASAEAVAALTNAGRTWVQELGGKPGGCLSVIESGAPPPDDRARRMLSAFFKELSATMQPLFVAEGSGFRVAWVRGVVLAVSALAPSLLPFKFAATVQEAGKLLEPVLTPAAGGASGLVSAMDACRAHLDRHGATLR